MPSVLPTRSLYRLALSLALAAAWHAGAIWAPSAHAGALPVPPSALRRAMELGLENVTADTAGAAPRTGFENRRYRHTADVLGRLQLQTPPPFTVVERRLGLCAAEISVTAAGDSDAFRVRYPSDRDYVAAPPGPLAFPTSHSVDFLLRPAFSYELGRLTAPIQVQVQLEPMVRYNPWPGGRLTGSVMIPVYNQFDFSDLHPDVENVRPGVLSVDQFVWIPGTALVSGSVGLLGENRFGASMGAARPMANGQFLADAQVDLTGFVAFEKSGLTYSTPRQWSTFAGVSWAVPKIDATLRLRGGQFLYGDRGVQVEFRRSFGDFEYMLFGLRSRGRTMQGVRVTLPVPPMTRGTQRHVRMQPLERWSLNYRTDATPLGTFVPGVASREDYLRQLSEPALTANLYRFDRAAGHPRRNPPEETIDWVNTSGATGFVFTPWAGVIREGTISLDYSDVPAKWAYSGRGDFVNQAYSMTIGLLPRIEATLRFTRLPGAFGFIEDVDNLITTDTDHEAGGRLVLLNPKNWMPGLAVGVEDISGTRRFHDTYLVAGLPLKIKLMQMRFSLGYAPTVFTAARHVLDGGFGAVEVSPWRDVAARAEYDTEKWNVGVGVVLPLGLRLRASALNLETLSVGMGWTHKL